MERSRCVLDPNSIAEHEGEESERQIDRPHQCAQGRDSRNPGCKEGELAASDWPRGTIPSPPKNDSGMPGARTSSGADSGRLQPAWGRYMKSYGRERSRQCARLKPQAVWPESLRNWLSESTRIRKLRGRNVAVSLEVKIEARSVAPHYTDLFLGSLCKLRVCKYCPTPLSCASDGPISALRALQAPIDRREALLRDCNNMQAFCCALTTGA